MNSRDWNDLLNHYNNNKLSIGNMFDELGQTKMDLKNLMQT